MKTIFKLFILFIGLPGFVTAQVHQIQLSMLNLVQTSDSAFQFELWIKNLTPDSVSKLSFIQFGADLPANIGNGGTMSIAKIAANPNLPATQQLPGNSVIQGQPLTPTIRVASQNTTAGLATIIPSTGNGIWYATYRVNNTVAFAPNTLVSFIPNVNQASSTKTRTMIAAFVNNASSGGTVFTVLGSTPIQSPLRELIIQPFPTLTINPPANSCPLSMNAQVSSQTCLANTGSANITLTPNPYPIQGTYTLNGGPAVSYNGNPFLITGLAPGSYTLSVTNQPGCAPLVQSFTVNSIPSLNNSSTVNACDSFLWSVTNSVYYTSGTYTGTSLDTNGCITNEELILNVFPSNSSNTTITACDSYFWPVTQMNYTQSGSFQYTTFNSSGCIEIHNLYLNILSGSSSNASVSAVQSYTWPCNGNTYSQSGVYTCISNNALGCPDTQNLALTIMPCNTQVSAPNIYACPGNAISLSGSPSGGSYSIPNPYTGPSTPYTYSYTDPSSGCTQSVTANIYVQSTPIVTPISVSNLSGSSATLNWVAVPGIGWYELRFKESNSSVWLNGGTQAAPATSKTIVGLSPGTDYDMEVRGWCAQNSPGPWSNGLNFTTTASCPTPNNLLFNFVGNNILKLSWDSIPGVAYFQTRYRTFNTSNNNAGSWVNGTTQTPFKMFAGLNPSTNYQWQVRAICNSSANHISSWTSLYLFNTSTSLRPSHTEENTEKMESFKVFPNITNNEFVLESYTLQPRQIDIDLFDVGGRKVKTIKTHIAEGGSTLEISLSGLGAGIYQIRVHDHHALILQDKILKLAD
jgi:hypothetical protein